MRTYTTIGTKQIFQLIIFIYLLMLAFTCSAQENNVDTNYIRGENGTKILLASLGKTTIILKNGSPKTKSTIMKIGTLDIEYLREGSLHDILIEKIKRIVPENDPYQIILFDDENKAFISSNTSPYIKKKEEPLPLETKKENPLQGHDLLILKNGDSLSCTILRQSSMYVFYIKNAISANIAKSEISKIKYFSVIPNEKKDSVTFSNSVHNPSVDTNKAQTRTNISKDTNNVDQFTKTDSIFLKNGSKFPAKIKEIGLTTITYTTSNATQHVVPRSDVYKIVLKNGYQEVFDRSIETENEIPKDVDYYEMGRRDGEIYFNGGSSMALGIVSVLLLHIGLILISVVALIPPADLYNSENPNNNLLSTNPEYKKGYRSAAHRKKARKIFGGFLIGLLIAAIILVIILLGVGF